MTIRAKTYAELTEALRNQGFFLVADLPQRIKVQTRRGMLVVRLS